MRSAFEAYQQALTAVYEGCTVAVVVGIDRVRTGAFAPVFYVSSPKSRDDHSGYRRSVLNRRRFHRSGASRKAAMLFVRVQRSTPREAFCYLRTGTLVPVRPIRRCLFQSLNYSVTLRGAL
jgi:hypothetical protein